MHWRYREAAETLEIPRVGNADIVKITDKTSFLQKQPLIFRKNVYKITNCCYKKLNSFLMNKLTNYHDEIP